MSDLRAVLLAVVTVLGSADMRAAAADEPANPMVEIGQLPPPRGWVDFCREHAADCRWTQADPVALTPARWAELQEINRKVNRAIKAREEGVADVWRYPDDGYGDCEDYALLKRRLLKEAGWPAGALLMATARLANGVGHAVLIVRTDHGEYVLDNRRNDILEWDQVGFTLLARQSAGGGGTWSALAPFAP